MDEIEAIREGGDALSRLQASGLPRFDIALREASPYGSSWLAFFAGLSPASVPRLARFSRDPDTLGILLAGHHSGWVREAALPLLVRRVTPLTVGMLILRSADWVTPIRQAAQALLGQVIATHGIDVLVPALPILEQLATEYARSAAYAREMLDLISSQVSTAAFVSSLHSPDRRLRRSLARMLARRADALVAVDAALSQDDPVTLALVAQAALAHDHSPELAERLWTAQSSRVRALALGRLLNGASDAAEVGAERALMDSNGYVRALAQGYFRERGVDVAERYVAALSASQTPRTTIEAGLRGLSETRAEKHRALVASFATHHSARVRDTVCRVIEDLGAAGYRELLFELAGDRSRRVARRAGHVLVGLGLTESDQERLWQSSLRRTDEALLAVLMRFDRWRQLALACRGISSGEARPVAHGHALLDHITVKWNASFTAPSPAVRRELSESLPSVLSLLDTERASQLRLQVRPFFPTL